MSSTSASSDDLEALFDSIVLSNATTTSEVKTGEVDCQPSQSSSSKEESAMEGGGSSIGPTDSAGSAEKVLSRVGQLTRTLHESLRALGYDKAIEETASAIPDARDRLAYVITMTKQAADRTLNAIDVMNPIQESLANRATDLSVQWDRLFAKELGIEEFKALVMRTRGFLGDVPVQTVATSAQLMEIMMAQDFQDLTGQVIKKTTEIIQKLEGELLQLLLDNIPQEKRKDASSGLMNGPVINADGRNDVVTSQNQVDDLLESLGF